MKRIHRITLSSAVVLTVFLFFVVLTQLSRKSEGPIARVLTDIGIALSHFEKSVTDLFRGPGRRAELSWFEVIRNDRQNLKNPSTILLGAYDGRIPKTLEGVVELEETLGTTFPLIHVYAAWGDRPDQQFPVRVMKAIWDLGSVPVVTLEPWLTDFESSDHPNLPLRNDRDRGGLAAIARGNYDFYIDAWARDAAEFGRPFFFRFAHEMNDPYRYPWGPHNNSVLEFLEAWRHVHQRLQAAGATNVIWVWSPHLGYNYYEFYPGDNYVDWVGTGVLNYGTVAYWSKWWTFEEIFGKRYLYIKALGKPIMIAEFGTLAIGGDRAEWYRKALERLPQRYPAVKALLFFHASSDATVTQQVLDWTLPNDTTSCSVVAQEIARWKSVAIEKQ